MKRYPEPVITGCASSGADLTRLPDARQAAGFASPAHGAAQRAVTRISLGLS